MRLPLTRTLGKAQRLRAQRDKSQHLEREWRVAVALTSSGAFEAKSGAGSAGGGEAGARHVSLPVECFSSSGGGKVLLYSVQLVPFLWSEPVFGTGGTARRRTSEEWRGVVQQVYSAIEWLGHHGVIQSDLGTSFELFGVGSIPPR